MRFLPIAVVAILLGTPVSAGAPVSLSLSAGVVPEGADVVVMVKIERHPDNRLLTIVWDGPISGMRNIQLEGEDSFSSFREEKLLRHLRKGSYLVSAILTRVTEGEHKHSMDQKQLLVGDAGDDF